MTPLMIAVDNMDFEKVRGLLELHMEINAADQFGQRALHFAVDSEVEEGQREAEKTLSRVEARADMTRLLLEHGADASVRDARGDTPLDWAIRLRPTLAEQLLRQYGA